MPCVCRKVSILCCECLYCAVSILCDLNKMQFNKLSVQAKFRVERVSNGIRDLVLNSLLALI